ncbi:MAG: winged helix-turn-helix transcriptional regulator [Salinibacterium sp.]|nr:winged helix-turn-helix transcriptional regulator [Salinibacterium sp.]
MQSPSRKPTYSLREFVELSRAFEAHLGEQLTVNPTDLAAMEHLISSGPLGPSELARRLKITPSAVTAAVDRLEELGHATRVVNPADRRAVVVTPAAESVQRAMSFLMPMIGDVDSILDGFDLEDQAVIADYLERVVAALRAHVPS